VLRCILAVELAAMLPPTMKAAAVILGEGMYFLSA